MAVLPQALAVLAWVCATSLAADCHVGYPCTREAAVGFWRVNCSALNLRVSPPRVCPNTTTLNLSDNMITILSAIDFNRDNLKYLQNLYLSRNAIESLRPETFMGLQHLLVLWMDHNKLTYLPSDLFYHTPFLGWLDLSYNPLKNPGQNWFINCKSLTWLNLENTGLTRLSRDTFNGLESLMYLDMGLNDLKSIPRQALDILKTLKKLRLEGNPIQCDCNLHELWKWASDNEINSNVVCAGPPNLASTSWERLKDLDCSPKMINLGTVALYVILVVLVIIVVLIGLVVMRQKRGSWGFVRKDMTGRPLPQIPAGEYIDILPPEKPEEDVSKLYETLQDERYVEAGRGSYLPMKSLVPDTEPHYVNSLKPAKPVQRLPMKRELPVPESPRRSSIPSILNGCDYYEVVD